MMLPGLLRAGRVGLVWWTIAIAAVAGLYTAFYPAIGGMDIGGMLATFPDEVLSVFGWDALLSGPGYVNATVFSLVGVALVLVCAISTGSRLIAGDDESGLLELELAAPVSRVSVYLQRLAVLWLTVLAPVLAIFVVVTVLNPILDIRIATTHLLAACLGLYLFTVAMGTVSFATGGLTGRRSHALAAGAGLAVVSYLLAYLGPLAEQQWMADISPYGWYNSGRPLINGADLAGMGFLLALSIVAAGAGALRFVRRDTGV